MKADFEKGTKVCNKCKQELPLVFFRKDLHQPDGMEYSCRECSLKRGRSYLKTKRTKEELSITRADFEKGAKMCSKCRKIFPLSNFHKCSANRVKMVGNSITSFPVPTSIFLLKRTRRSVSTGEIFNPYGGKIIELRKIR